MHLTVYPALQHNAVPANVSLDLCLSYRHHGYGCCCGQPVGLVIAAGIIADLVGGAVEERDGTESRKAGPRLSWRERSHPLIPPKLVGKKKKLHLKV